MSTLIDLTGQRFGRLVVTCRAENKGKFELKEVATCHENLLRLRE